MTKISLPELTTSKLLWDYLRCLQPALANLLSFFGCEDAYISVSQSVEGAGPVPETRPFGNNWVVNDGLHMDGEPDEFVRAAETLTELVAAFGDSTDNFNSSKPMPAGYGTINHDGWIVAVTGPDTEVICSMVANIVMTAINTYNTHAALKPPA